MPHHHSHQKQVKEKSDSSEESPPQKRSRGEINKNKESQRKSSTASFPPSHKLTRRESTEPRSSSVDGNVTLQSLLDSGIVEEGNKSFKLKFENGEGRNAALITKNAWLNDGYETYPTVLGWVLNILSKKGIHPRLEDTHAWALVSICGHNLAEVEEAFKAYINTNGKSPSGISIYSLMRGYKKSSRVTALQREALDIKNKFIAKQRTLAEEKEGKESPKKPEFLDTSEESSSEEKEKPIKEEEEEVTMKDPQFETQTNEINQRTENNSGNIAPRPIVGFVNQNLPQIECPMCLFVLEDPVVLQCTHSICRKCSITLINRAITLSTIPQYCRINNSNNNNNNNNNNSNNNLRSTTTSIPTSDFSNSNNNLISIKCPMCESLSTFSLALSQEPFANGYQPATPIEPQQPICSMHGKELISYDVSTKKALCQICVDEMKEKSNGKLLEGVYEIGNIASVYQTSLLTVSSQALTIANSFKENAERLETVSIGMDEILAQTLRQIEMDANSMKETIDRRQKELTQRCTDISKSRQTMLKDQARLFRLCSEIITEDANLAESVGKTSEGGTHRLLRVVPILQKRVNDHSTEIVKKEPCCPLSIHYESPQEGVNVTGISLWGTLHDENLSLSKSAFSALVNGKLSQGKLISITVNINSLRNSEGERIPFAERLLCMFEVCVIYHGERQSLISRSGWNKLSFSSGVSEFFIEPKFSNIIQLQLQNVGDYSVVVFVGESQKREVCNFFVSTASKRGRRPRT